ncbi:cytochrome P450, partial [Streptomyces sp. NPDC055078]
VGDRDRVTVEDVPRLVVIRRVLEEVARLHGVTMLMRRATTPVELGGFTLPAGTEVAFSLYAVHRDPRLFTDADSFDPDRWLPERQEAHGPNRAFIPFGAGAHKCLGAQFAWTEATIAIATVLGRWHLVPVAGHTPREVASAVVHADRLPMTVEPRRAG